MSSPLRILRVYHAGRDAAHRARERALVAAGIDVTLVVPREWPGGEAELSPEPFRIVELDVRRPGDVNRHHYPDEGAIRALLDEARPDVLDLHEEPFSVAARQWLRAAPPELPVVMYTAQNVDKRFPPPFHQWERAAHRRVAALYPCSRQAASVARGKGFAGRIEVLPLGYEPEIFQPGEQSLDDPELVLAFAGRLVPEKGVDDAVQVATLLAETRPTRLVVCGEGPVAPEGEGVDVLGPVEPAMLARVFRSAHFALVPSRPTATWTEQFGRVIVEAQASGAVVAGYDSGSIGEVGGDPALLVPTGDAQALAERILELDPAEFERRRREGIALAGGRTWPRVGEAQSALYREVVAGVERMPLPRSAGARRAEARAEFGPTASTTAGPRPSALPVLRRIKLRPR